VVSTRIDWVREHCRLLRGIADEFGRTRPFDGLTIGTGIHLEAKTVALLLTLRDGGARLIWTGSARRRATPPSPRRTSSSPSPAPGTC
jgi:adenosylhomocysteinase